MSDAPKFLLVVMSIFLLILSQGYAWHATAADTVIQVPTPLLVSKTRFEP